MKLWMCIVVTKEAHDAKRFNWISAMEVVQAKDENACRALYAARAVKQDWVSEKHFEDGLAEVLVRPF